MLVLARRPEESILFPTLGISVEVLRITGQIVRVGVKAPRDIPILRSELQPHGAKTPTRCRTESVAKTLDHQMRGRFNTAMMAMYVAQKQAREGLTSEMDATLQMVLDELESLEKAFSAARSSSTPRTDVRRLRTLLVDDNANESALLVSYLQLSGVEAVRASDGCDALDYLKCHERPDAVLLDMHMPRCDGPTMLSVLRADAQLGDIKVFGVSGAAPADYNLPLGKGGVDGWFRKPLNPQEIVQVLANTVQLA